MKKKTAAKRVTGPANKKVSTKAKPTHDDDAAKRQKHIEPLLRGEQSPGNARAVIENFLKRHNSASEQYRETMAWLAYALRQVLDGKDANAAFGLKQDSKRPLDIQAHNRDFLIAAAALLLFKVTGWQVKRINSTLSEEFNVSVKTVERAIKKCPEVDRRHSVLPTQLLISIIREVGGASILNYIEAVARKIGDKPTIRYFKTSTDKKPGT